jgi:integrase
LDDLDWQHSRIRIRAQKGGKEVVLPLMQAVGEALIQYLQHRPGQTPSRTLFLRAKAPYRALDSVAVSKIVHRHLEQAGVTTSGLGSRTLRHSWAIRALAHDSPIKAIGEALNLTLGDIDAKRRVIEVREGKFRKSRYVPLSPSAARQLARYLRRRRAAGFSTAPSAPVFLNIIGARHGHPGFVTLFLELLRSLGLRGPKGQPGPRIHDLRHTFAVHRLLAWYRQGANLAAKLPLLSTYLGHSTITGTEVYLHATAQLLESVGQRFHAHFAIPLRSRAKRHEEA